MERRQLNAEIILFSMTIIWGITFPLMKGAVATMPPFIFLFIRFLISALTLIPFIKLKLDKKTILAGFYVGIFLFLGMAFQTVGLVYTEASKSGFITALFVVFIPIVDFIFFKTKTSLFGVLGVITALIGIFLITNPKEGGINFGDLLTIASAVCYAFQIIFIGRFTKKHNVKSVVFYQILTTSLLSLLFSFVFKENHALQFNNQVLIALFVTGILGTTVAFMIQGKYQQRTSSLRAGLIFSFEPLSALFFSYIILSETLGVMAIFGGLLIMLGIIFSNFGISKS